VVNSARRRRRAGYCLATALALVVPATAAAQPRSREAREAEARKACAAGQVEKGIEVLAELLVELGHPNYVYNQARCYQQNGRAEEAINRFREYLRAAPKISASERQRVEGFVSELQAELARRNAARPADTHAAETSPTTEPTTTRPPPPAPPEPEKPEVKVASKPEAPPGDRGQTLRQVGYALGGVGVLGLAFGAYSSYKVRALADDTKQMNLPKGTPDPNEDAGHRYEKLQYVGYGLGAAAIVGAVVCLVLGNQDSDGASALVLPQIGPHGAGALVQVGF
jgi:tetratricopeptide (TPR) repeat protein